MAVAIRIPKLGLTMESAVIAAWSRPSGDQVKEGETVLVIETDKVTYEVPAPADGFLVQVIAEGETCPVEETVGYIAADRAELESLTSDLPSGSPKTGAGSEEEQPEPVQEAAQPSGTEAGKTRIKASPLARRMAAEHGLDLAALKGSGPGGRIVRQDILKALETPPKAASAPEAASETPPAVPVMEGKGPVERVPIKGVRRVIFGNMAMSLSRTAQLTIHTEACAEALIALRNRSDRGGEGKVSFNAILVKVAAAALGRHPGINASVEEDEICLWKQVNIGLAMESDGALVVPVVRTPDRKTIREIDGDIRILIDKARNRGLLPDDLGDGTFTISNLGFADVDHFTPILRPPESGILGVGRILRKPVVRDDQVVPESRIGLSLTFDHRIIDGAPAARFLKTLKDMIEDPLEMIC